MQYFIDTEFNEHPNTIELISIGIVSADGREYYAISSEYDVTNCDEWVIDNVIVPMFEETVPNDRRAFIGLTDFQKTYGKTIRSMRQEILEFLNFPTFDNSTPEFWAYYAAYDWVVFCWIFGKMIDLPEGMPMYCNDLMQLFSTMPDKAKLAAPEGEHNALVDARWNRDFYMYLTNTGTNRLQPTNIQKK